MQYHRNPDITGVTNVKFALNCALNNHKALCRHTVQKYFTIKINKKNYSLVFFMVCFVSESFLPYEVN